MDILFTKPQVKMQKNNKNHYTIINLVSKELDNSNHEDLSAFFISKAIVAKNTEEVINLAKKYVEIIEIE